MFETSPSRKGATTLLVAIGVLVALALAAVAVALFYDTPGNENSATDNSNSANAAQAADANAVQSDPLANEAVASSGDGSGGSLYESGVFFDPTASIGFRLPSGLEPREDYPEILDTTDVATAIQKITLGVFPDGYGGVEVSQYLDAVSLELLDLDVISPLAQLSTMGQFDVFQKVYTASAPSKLSGEQYAATIYDTVLKNHAVSYFVFARIYGRTGSDADRAVEDLLSSVMLEQ